MNLLPLLKIWTAFSVSQDLMSSVRRQQCRHSLSLWFLFNALSVTNILTPEDNLASHIWPFVGILHKFHPPRGKIFQSLLYVNTLNNISESM